MIYSAFVWVSGKEIKEKQNVLWKFHHVGRHAGGRALQNRCCSGPDRASPACSAEQCGPHAQLLHL